MDTVEIYCPFFVAKTNSPAITTKYRVFLKKLERRGCDRKYVCLAKPLLFPPPGLKSNLQTLSVFAIGRGIAPAQKPISGYSFTQLSYLNFLSK